jgi:hypothetical protein
MTKEEKEEKSCIYQIHGIGSTHCYGHGDYGSKVDPTVPQLSGENLN